MKDKLIGLALLLICALIVCGFLFAIGGWISVLVGALTVVAILSGICGGILLVESW